MRLLFADAHALLEEIEVADEERREWEAGLHGIELAAGSAQEASADDRGRETAAFSTARDLERRLQERLAGRR